MKEKYDSSHIQILQMPESIRQRPAMYVGSTTCRGFTGQLLGLIGNAFHQTQSNDVTIRLNEDFSGTIRFSNIKKPIDSHWFLPNYKKRFFWDLEVLNALSDQFTIKFYDKKEQVICEQYFEKGDLKRGVFENKKYKIPTLTIDFQLDKEIWANFTEWNVNQLIYEIWDFAFLYKTIKFDIHYAVENEPCRIIYQFKNGLKDRIAIEKYKGLAAFYAPFCEAWEEKKFNGFSLEVAFVFKAVWVDKPFFKSYANDDFTSDEGSHVEGFFEGMARGWTIFQQRFDPKLPEITPNDVRNELIAAIRIKMDRPNFKGSVRQAINHPEIVEPIAAYISELFLKKNDEDAAWRERLTPTV
jgi:DNA gyrase subunit B